VESCGISIKEYAVRRAKALAIKISVVGFLVATVLVIGGTLLSYCLRLDYAASALESSVVSSLTFGDYFQLKRTMISLSKSDGVVSASVYSSNGKPIASSEFAPALHTDNKVGFSVVGPFFEPTLKLSNAIKYGAENNGRLEIKSRLPIVNLIFLLMVIAGLFGIFSYLIVDAAKKTALAIVNPTTLLSEEIKKMDSKNQSYSFNSSEFKFKEIAEAYEQFLGLLTRTSEANEARKKYEQEALVGRIATKVKHDVKQALFATSAVIPKLAGPVGHLEIMKASLKRIEDTVDEIPKISLGSGDLTNFAAKAVSSELNKSTLDDVALVSLIAPVCDEFRAILSAQPKSIELIFDHSGNDMDLKVRVNTAHFRRMLANVLANSVEAISSVGRIHVCIERCASNKVVILIRDTGAGIPEEVRHRVGKPGFSFGKKNGSGLGVSTAIEYVNSWDGEFTFTSEVGLGTTIRIELPLIAKQNVSLLNSESKIHTV